MDSGKVRPSSSTSSGTLPAGFMENNETTAQAAQRETEEEAGANIQLHDLFSILNVPHVHQVHLFYRATLLDLNYAAGVESLAVQLFSEKEIGQLVS